MPKMRGSPGAILPRDMNERQWGTYIGNLRSDDIREGQTAYDTGTGFWLGLDGGVPKFSIGDSTADKLTWDGSSLSINGTITGAFTLGAGNIDTLTLGYTGFSSDPTHTTAGSLVGLTYNVYIKNTGSYGTSNSTSFTITGLPTNPVASAWLSQPFVAVDNGSYIMAFMTISGGGTGTLYAFNGTTFSATGWTNAGTKGIAASQALTFYYNPYLWA